MFAMVRVHKWIIEATLGIFFCGDFVPILYNIVDAALHCVDRSEHNCTIPTGLVRTICNVPEPIVCRGDV